MCNDNKYWNDNTHLEVSHDILLDIVLLKIAVGWVQQHIDGLVWGCGNSSASAMGVIAVLQ